MLDRHLPFSCTRGAVNSELYTAISSACAPMDGPSMSHDEPQGSWLPPDAVRPAAIAIRTVAVHQCSPRAHHMPPPCSSDSTLIEPDSTRDRTPMIRPLWDAMSRGCLVYVGLLRSGHISKRFGEFDKSKLVVRHVPILNSSEVFWPLVLVWIRAYPYYTQCTLKIFLHENRSPIYSYATNSTIHIPALIPILSDTVTPHTPPPSYLPTLRTREARASTSRRATIVDGSSHTHAPRWTVTVTVTGLGLAAASEFCASEVWDAVTSGDDV
ncbi:hypothetical protein EVG20_g8731 [Dentipellis fragilis]|uniref:Uncharacterized protein n=1 Tax=Dentipellis fragilis TaxID=205917 RepID=A0A4Y9Y5R1_9AGAM|nr:hypothetical protein EVG20_g8731 [Dentipellis fragilis]